MPENNNEILESEFEDSVEAVCELDEEIVNEDEPNEKDVLGALQEEIASLKAELKAREELERARERINLELAEFEEYFPDVDLHTIPKDVWEKVREGVSLAATYSLYQRKLELEKRKIGDLNEQNRRMSAGALTRADGDKYFSPSEVKRMKPAQIKKHYDDIIESMRHWN